METLDSLSRFVDEYPQIREDKLQYAFLGGTAIRLNQEAASCGEERRPISDFDIIRLENGNYPVHGCTLEDVFGSISINRGEFNRHVSKVNIKGRDYHFMDGDFLTVTKTCAIDTPREKDFRDVRCLVECGLVDFDRLRPLYEGAQRITKNTDLVIDCLKWLLDSPNVGKIKLFQTFPRLVNLVDEFKDHKRIRELLLGYAVEDQKPGYELASVIYDIHCLVRECQGREKLKILAPVLTIASRNDYRDFDRIVHEDLIPKIRYAGSQTKRRKVIKHLSE